MGIVLLSEDMVKSYVISLLYPMQQREQFFLWFPNARKGCLFCTQPMCDAHHILDRALFSDGGYDLSNLAGVCAEHHWQCEITVLSVQEVLDAANIPNRLSLVHHGISDTQLVDKWGNLIFPSGMRTWGPMEQHQGMRKALAAGGFLGWMMPQVYRETS